MFFWCEYFTLLSIGVILVRLFYSLYPYICILYALSIYRCYFGAHILRFVSMGFIIVCLRFVPIDVISVCIFYVVYPWILFWIAYLTILSVDVLLVYIFYALYLLYLFATNI